MRKITVLSMISLDGVLQAPGGTEEDTSNGFAYGGWTNSYSDEAYGKAVREELQPADYLLGRKTFEIWENYWPEHGDFWPSINTETKYIFSNTRTETAWGNTQFIQSVDDIKKIKNSAGANIQVWGSSELIHLLLENDLVDELRLKIHPLLLGKGKKLFNDDTNPSTFKLVESTVTSTGVILARYQKLDQKIKTGNVEV